jgi:site-specific recombinase XerD
MELPGELEAWFDDYTAHLRRTGGRGGRPRSQATIAAYRKSFDRFWRWALAHGIDPDPAAVDHRVVNRWTDQMRTEVSPATVAILWRNARPFFSWWAREEGAANPFERADVPGIPETSVPVLDLDDVRLLFATCSTREFDDVRDRAALMVLLDCGIRLGELVTLDVGDWDRKADLLYVDGKSGPRAVPHGPTTHEALARYLRARAKHPYAATTERLWLGRRGAWGISGPQQMLVRRCKLAGLPRLHAHLFRHLWAHQAKDAGISDGDLMVLAGWTTTAMAQRYGSSAAAARAQRHYRPLSLGERL